MNALIAIGIAAFVAFLILVVFRPEEKHYDHE